MLEPFIYPRSIDAAPGRRRARAARAVPRSGRRGRRARRDGLRRQAGRGRHPRRRDGRAGAAAAARRQAAATCASATRRARSRAWWWPGCSAIARRWTLLSAYRFWRRLEHRVQVGDRRADATACPATTTARARFAARAGLRRPGGVRRRGARASARRSRRSRRRWASRRRALHLEAARLLDPLRDRAELERLAAAAGLPRRRGRGRHAGGGRARACRRRCWRQAIASPDPDRALLHFRDLIWRGSDGADGAAARRAAAGAHAGRRCSAPAIGWRICWSATRRCGTRWSRGWARACARATSCSARLARGAAAATARRRRRARRRGSCARSAASRPRRRCASACTTWPASLEPGEVAEQLTDLAEVCLAAGDRARRCRRWSARYGEPRAGADRAGARQPGRARDALRLRPRPGVSLRRRRREHHRRRPPRVVRARLAAVHLGDGGDAGGGAPLQGRHPPAPVGRAGAAGDVVERRSSATTATRRPAGSGWRCCARASSTATRTPALRAQREADAGARSRSTARSTSSASSPICAACARASRRERGRVPAGSRHLRFDPGGIMDVEFLVALGQLRHAADPGVRDHDDRRRARRAWSRSAGRRRCSTTTRSCAARRCACACCSIARRTSCRPAISRCSPAASERPPTRWPPSSTRAWRACARCSTNVRLIRSVTRSPDASDE